LARLPDTSRTFTRPGHAASGTVTERPHPIRLTQRHATTAAALLRQRAAVLRWAPQAFKTFRVIPPGAGICHQVNLERLAQVDVARDRAIVCLVGQDLKFTPGLAARMFRTIEDVNVLMISQGASRRNVSFVVEEREVEPVVRRLHAEFFE